MKAILRTHHRGFLFSALLFGAVMSSGWGWAADARVAVTFRLHSPDLSDDTMVFITGSIPELGLWDPGQVAMTGVGEHTWQHTVRARRGEVIEYKYTLGSWQREGANADERPLSNLSVTVGESMVQKDEIRYWTKPSDERRPVGQVTGTVRLHRQLTGEGVLPRDLTVWLPPGYETSVRRYGVLYLQDGQNIVDPATSAFGVDWGVDETCTALIEKGVLEPMIVVGIHNTPDRSREYLPGAKGTAYLRFVVEVVKPFIDEHYRTKPDRSHTSVGGSSAGGLCAFRLAWEHSEAFSRALCMSPAFRVERNSGELVVDYVSQVVQSPRPEHQLLLYIDNGGVGLEASLQPGIDAMLSALDEKGFRRGLDYFWVHDSQAGHSESAWAERLPDALLKLFGQ